MAEITCEEIINKLTKAKRKFDVCQNWRHAILYCESCGKKLGEFDLFYESHEANKFCTDCVQKYKNKHLPKVITDELTLLEDNGSNVIIRYERIRQEVSKQCYFNSKGRYIKIKNKRWYI